MEQDYDEYIKQLKNDYPNITFDGFICHPEGWNNIIRYLLESTNKNLHYLKRIIEKYKLEFNIHFNVFQTKEKFGGLRFYYDSNIREFNFFLKELSTEQKKLIPGYIIKDCEYITDYIDKRVSVIEGLSFYICETCGSMDQVKVKADSYWITTECNNCRIKKHNPV